MHWAIYNGLHPFVELAGGLLERQYGFQRVWSTFNAIATVVDLKDLSAVRWRRWMSVMALTRATMVSLKAPWLN